ncbi:Cytochrome P450 3A31 [Orchesella cincta]|uniref:Cytochrome P450 3A31 n=1 Tax=Orchesella cincta TaxID=48709 RepID=A0A1D2MXF5_ORCCI|nr:Cytochrome P450 3A31 [Orchesella cincta]
MDCFDVPIGKTSIFEDMGKKFQFNLKPILLLKFIFIVTLPKIADMMKIEVMDTVPQNYFADGTVPESSEFDGKELDFLQLMLDAQEGLLKIDDDTNEVMNGTTEKNILNGASVTDKQKITFDDDDIIANSFGFDTTQSLLLFAVYQLALEQEVQEKVYKDVKAAVDANDGKISYDGLLNMTYLEMFLNETLRFFPPAGRTERICTKDYPVPGTNIVIEKGTLIAIPIYPIHRDAKYWENPTKFEPERFLVDRKSSRNTLSFMPFGHGPRNCIGLRFAMTEVKAVISTLVQTFKFETCLKTTIPMQFDSNSNLKPKYGMWLKVTPR